MEWYKIEEWDGGCCIARYNGEGRFDMWNSKDGQWKLNDDYALRVCCTPEDDFYSISKEEAVKKMQKYGKKQGKT